MSTSSLLEPLLKTRCRLGFDDAMKALPPTVKPQIVISRQTKQKIGRRLSKSYSILSCSATNGKKRSAQGQHLQLILYSPPKLQKHHLWALKPLQLDSEQYIPGYEFQDVLVARNIERAHRLALHQQEGLASLDMQHLLSAVSHEYLP